MSNGLKNWNTFIIINIVLLTITITIITTMDNLSNKGIDTYKLRLVYVDGEEYGFDDIDLQLVDLKTYLAIGVYTGEDQDKFYFTREDFDFY